jgi:cytoskeletal protein RodZ
MAIAVDSLEASGRPIFEGNFEMQSDRICAGQFGQKLAAARLESGMTIADVADRTKVPRRYLAAIEREELEHLPSRVHAVGFATAFARAVHTEESEIAEAIKSNFQATLLPIHPGNSRPSARIKSQSRLVRFLLAARATLSS